MKRFAEILTKSTSTCSNQDMNSLHPHNSPWWPKILEHVDQTGWCSYHRPYTADAKVRRHWWVLVQIKSHVLRRVWWLPSHFIIATSITCLFCLQIFQTIGHFDKIRFVPGSVSRQPTTAVTAGSIPSTTVYWNNDAREPRWVQGPGNTPMRRHMWVCLLTNKGFSFSVFILYFVSLDVDSWGCTQHRCSLSATLEFGIGSTCLCSCSVSVMCGTPALLPLPPLLFLLIIARPQSANHHSLIPHILTWDSRGLMATSCCLQEPLLHKCQTVRFNITCHVFPNSLTFFTSNLAEL